MALDSDAQLIRNELDRLYKSLYVVHARSNRLIEEIRRRHENDPLTDPLGRTLAQYQARRIEYSLYADNICKAIGIIDPLWSKTWANYHAEKVLTPNEYVHPPVLSPGQLLSPPSNMDK